eukprot:CAMPEP_0113890860 /NCGR_PEP_ID=MMETSP0780_2-20120614/14406_1 /TAXON_ID=652834 /ORGANISM="Palpitomonas bilix" /LENGTH=317 /DNA_ID=CAMNT_0000880355 /DNA_START=94 /DNA_END=1043 /DNA_ORIENTATION=+ /assembly_acc=CAM_ASM_000599
MTMEVPWIEKYRPRTIDDVASQEEAVGALNNCLKTRQFPHLLFYGPAGTGKTSTILALCRQMFGDAYKDRVLELNASDERGINVVRDKIKSFASRAVSTTSKLPGFKIIILDEADAMTRDAQTALRRTMEIFSSVTRFCLICNYVSRIIEPLASRCAKFRFNSLSSHTMLSRLQAICTSEKINVDDTVVSRVIELTGGDMRKAVSTLQTLHSAYGSRAVTVDDVVECTGRVKDHIIVQCLANMKKKSLEDLQEWANNLILDGYSPDAAVRQLSAEISTDEDIDDLKKARMCLKLQEVDGRLSKGSDGFCQLLDGLFA